MVDVQSACEIRARVDYENLQESRIIPVENPHGEEIVLFDKECDATYSVGPVRRVPLPDHKVEMLLDGEVCVWDLIDDVPDVRLKVKGVGPAHW